MLEFQHYFVREQCRPRVHAVHYHGAEGAVPAPGALAALSDPRLAGIIICPSNPYLSVDPILAVPGLRAAIRAAGVPVIAVSPIVGAQAIKGPTAKIMAELGVEVDARSVGAHYGGLLDGFVVDTADTGLQDDLQIPVHVTNTVMRSLTDKTELSQACIAFCEQLYRGTRKESVD
jgi:LPPG:FO 2-phospho-L-lactate transferase